VVNSGHVVALVFGVTAQFWLTVSQYMLSEVACVVVDYWSSSSSSSSDDSCDAFSSFSSFLGLPLRFPPAGGAAALALPLAAVLFLLPFGRPLGLLGVGDPLGSSEVLTWGFLRGLPRPLFSVASFSFGETVPLSLMFAL